MASLATSPAQSSPPQANSNSNSKSSSSSSSSSSSGAKTLSAAPSPPIAPSSPDSSPLPSLSDAEELRLRGNEHYKKGDLEGALKCYSDGVAAVGLDDEDKDKDEDEDGARNAKVTALLSNLSLVQLRLDLVDDCVETCCRCLRLDGCHVKCLVRRGRCYGLLGDDFVKAEEEGGMDGTGRIDLYAKALADFDKALEHAAGDTQTINLVNKYKVECEGKKREEEGRVKEEVMGKLKDLGNSVLGNFGLRLVPLF